jgi:hypothetical protein
VAAALAATFVAAQDIMEYLLVKQEEITMSQHGAVTLVFFAMAKLLPTPLPTFLPSCGAVVVLHPPTPGGVEGGLGGARSSLAMPNTPNTRETAFGWVEIRWKNVRWSCT